MVLLLYINTLKKNYKGENIYEFIFGETIDISFGENWYSVPASAYEVDPPPIEYITNVGTMITNQMELECVQQSDYFSVIDAVDNIIALGWEKEPIEGQLRLVFHFGEDVESVKNKLYSRDLEIKFESTEK